VVAKELKCFELAGGTFTVQLNSNGVARASAPDPALEACGDRIDVSGLRTGWIDVSLDGRPGTPVGCPWTVTSKRGYGPLPTIPPRPAESSRPIGFFDAEEQGYLVILGSGPKNDPSTRAVAETARALFPSADVRTDDVWEGCIH
jgi:hypothetical protein